DRAEYFLAVAHDARIGQQAVNVAFAVARDLIDIELVERLLERRPLAAHHTPVESGPEHEPGQHLEVRAVIFRRLAYWEREHLSRIGVLRRAPRHVATPSTGAQAMPQQGNANPNVAFRP